MGKSANALLATAFLALPGAAAAQIVTDGTLGPSGAVAPVGGIYTIDQSLGQTAGLNLFHSFSQFDVPTATEAQFTGVASLQNIIARVTGGDISDIDGLVSVVGPTDANLFLINPAGIAITGGAQFNIPSWLYLSTAQELHFANGATFPIAAITPSGALSIAAPESFGFLGGQGDISFDGAGAGLDGQRLHVSAADVSISNSVFSPSALDVFAEGTGSAQLAFNSPFLNAPFAGDITISGSSVVTFSSATASGDVRLGGGTVTMISSDLLSSVLSSGEEAGSVRLDVASLQILDGAQLGSSASLGVSGAVSIDASGGVVISGARDASPFPISSSILTGHFQARPHFAGLISINAGGLEIHAGGQINPFGGLDLEIDGVMILDEDPARADDHGVGDFYGAGHIDGFGAYNISAGSLLIQGTYLNSSGFPIAINIDGDVVIDGGIFESAGIASDTSFVGGGSGAITIAARSLRLVDGGSLFSSTFGDDNAGAITLDIDGALVIDGNGIPSDMGYSTGIFSETYLGTGDSGDVTVTAASIVVLDAGEISSSTFAPGNAGSISLTAGSINILGGGSILTRTAGGGDAGALHLIADALVVDGSGSNLPTRVNSTSTGEFAFGQSGAIVLDVTTLSVTAGGEISTDADRVAAGDIIINMPRNGILLIGGDGPPGSITTSSGADTGGRISINNPLAVIADGSEILALGQAVGANIEITSGFFIRSADSFNRLEVDGALVLDSRFEDVSQGTEAADVSYLDASRVLRGQCPNALARGEASQLGVLGVGPYARDSLAPAPRADASGVTQCAVAW